MAKEQNLRIEGVTLNPRKQILYSIQAVYGIGKTRAGELLDKAGIERNKPTKDITEDELAKIRDTINSSNFKIEGELKQEIFRNINILKNIKSYRGMRHKVGLPVRGQNTRKNARTRKGKVKMAVGGLNKQVSKK